LNSALGMALERGAPVEELVGDGDGLGRLAAGPAGHGGFEVLVGEIEDRSAEGDDALDQFEQPCAFAKVVATAPKSPVERPRWM
jgi:hypothetical protein